MSLVHDDDERMLQDAAREFLATESPVSAQRSLRDAGDPTGFSPVLWKKMADMGWAGILVPEAHGGLGFAHAGAGILCEQMGRTLCASPFLSTAVIGVTLLVNAGSEARRAALLPSIADGSLLLSLAVDETPRHDPRTINCAAAQTGDGFRLQGTKQAVVDATVADMLIVAARTSGNPDDAAGISLFLVPASAPGVAVQRISSLDSRNIARVTLTDVQLGPDALIGTLNEGRAALERALDVGRICLAAELLGIASEAFARTVDYLKQRRQFGKLIGEYQGLQHRAAVLFCEIENTRSAVMAALRAADHPSVSLAAHASLAKAKACSTATLAVNEAVQMHGGIGMTDDLEIGFFMKRAGAARALLGDSYFHADRYASANGY